MSKIALWFYRNEGGNLILQKLITALEALGHEVYVDFDMRECVVESGKVLTNDGVDLTSYDLFYHMNADEQSVYQRTILKALDFAKVKVINPYHAFNNAQDKFFANLLLQQAGIQVPPGLLIHNQFKLDYFERLFSNWSSIIVKQRRGHGGKGILKFDHAEQLYDFIHATNHIYDNYYLEKYIPFGEIDYRIDLIDGEVVGGYSRKRNHRFKTNVHARAEMLPIPPKQANIDLAIRATEVLGIPTAIVDIVESEKDNTPYVIEVNPLLGVFTGVGLQIGVNTIQSVKDIHPVFAYDDRKINMLVAYLDRLCKHPNKRLAYVQ